MQWNFISPEFHPYMTICKKMYVNQIYKRPFTQYLINHRNRISIVFDAICAIQQTVDKQFKKIWLRKCSDNIRSIPIVRQTPHLINNSSNIKFWHFIARHSISLSCICCYLALVPKLVSHSTLHFFTKIEVVW